MPYISELLIHNDKPLMLARIKGDGTIVNGGNEGYECRCINNLTEKAMAEFGHNADMLRKEFPNSNPEDAIGELTCPILGNIPKYPYTAEDGYTYEKELWNRWASECRTKPDGLTSPVTRANIKNDPVDNNHVKSIIGDVVVKLKEKGKIIEVGPGKTTINEIWEEFKQRQKENFGRLGESILGTSLVTTGSTTASAQGNPLEASSLGTSAVSSTALSGSVAVDSTIDFIADSTVSGSSMSSVLIGNTTCE